MFSFDVTFFIQIIHFICAWWFIKTFLFNHLIAAVTHEDSVIGGLQRKIDEESNTIAALCLEQKKQYEFAYSEYKKQIPSMETSSITQQKNSEFKECALSEKDKKTIIETVTTDITRKLFNV